MPTADGPFCITSVHQHLLTIDQNAAPTTSSISRAAYAPLKNTTSIVDEESHNVKGDGSCNENKHQVPGRKTAESEQYDDGRYAHPKREANEKI